MPWLGCDDLPSRILSELNIKFRDNLILVANVKSLGGQTSRVQTDFLKP
jgi:hypothetical protein